MAWTGSEDIGPMEKADAQLVERPRRLSTGGFRLFSRTKRVVLGVIILMTLIFFMPMDKIRLWHKSADNLDLEGATEYRNEQSHIGKVCIVYGATVPYYERALETHKRHNRLHGYTMFIQREPVLDGYWTKPAHILSVLLTEMSKPASQRLRWLWWFDADTIILNYKMPLETFLPDDGDDGEDDKDEENVRVDFVTTNDHNGLNNGIFAVRVCDRAIELFAEVLAFRDMRPDTHLTFADQSAMEYLLQERKFASHYATVPQRWFNAWPIVSDPADVDDTQAHPGDLAVHFAGMYAERPAAMTEWNTRSERESPVWNVAAADTGYPAAARRFYAARRERLRRVRKTWRAQAAKLLVMVKEAETTLAGGGVEGMDTPKLYVDALRGATDAANTVLERKAEAEEEDVEERKDVGQADVDLLTVVMANLEKAATLWSGAPMEAETAEEETTTAAVEAT